ncbi:hypothetical protein HK101_010754 [Irineochytrium annulatum]|nr:hypothetical protein HK101_010754 [Irineochytrium annulatum]
MAVLLPLLALLALLVIVPVLLLPVIIRRVARGLKPTYPPQRRDVPKDAIREPGIVYVHLPNLMPWGYPNASPFSCKLETWLRMSGIKYAVIRDFDLKKAPKGKIPWIELDGMKMGDSELIINYLNKLHPSNDCSDSHLSASDRAISTAFKRLVSESFPPSMGYSRNHENVSITLDRYSDGKMNPWVKWFVGKRISASLLKKLKAQGIGAHSRDEIYAIGNDNLRAISDFLGDKPFLMGNEPSQVDASMFGILTSTLWIPVEFPCKTYAYEECPNLHPYLLRIRDRFYADTLEDSMPWYTGGRD